MVHFNPFGFKRCIIRRLCYIHILLIKTIKIPYRAELLLYLEDSLFRKSYWPYGFFIIVPNGIPEDFFIPEEKLGRWEYLKGSKKEQRVHKETGTTWQYSEGAVTFPDALNRPSRTIVTGEGGTSPSRFKHVIHSSNLDPP